LTSSHVDAIFPVMFTRVYQIWRPRNPLCKPHLLLCLLVLCPAVGLAQTDTVPVVTTLPVLRDFVQAIGGPHVAVKSLINGLESEHTYTPKPSDVLSVSQARMLVKVGLGLEIWVNDLIRNAENHNLLTVTTSEGVPLIKDTEDHDSSEKERAEESFKERHSMGNPHIWLDPENAKTMIRHITDGLIKVDPAHKAQYLKNQSNYLKALSALEDEIKRKVRGLPDRRIITHHAAWPYFARRFGFIIEDTIVLQVGTEPSARHIQELIDKIRRKKIRVIASEPQLNPQVPNLLAQETGVRVVILSPLPGSIPGTDTYLDLIRYDAEQPISALGERR